MSLVWQMLRAEQNQTDAKPRPAPVGELGFERGDPVELVPTAQVQGQKAAALGGLIPL